jgi:ubiquitin-protein ligase
MPLDQERAMRSTPRTRRLHNDWKALQQLQLDSSIFRVRAHGVPPETYDLFFDGEGLRLDDGTVKPQRSHHVEVVLGANYPRVMPGLRWRTPIFHPNISSGGAVCLGGYQKHWVPSLDMAELAEMLWDMIRYANYDATSPYNREAALWANRQTHYKLPIDPRPLRDQVALRPRPVNTPAEPVRASQDDIVLADLVDETSIHRPPTSTSSVTSDTSRSNDDVWFLE